MDSPSPSKYPNQDGLPLSQLSPSRVNGRVAKNNIMSTTSALSHSSPIRKKYDEGITATFFSPGIAQSPSLPEFSVIRDRFQPVSDVSGLVKRFEHLDVRDRDAESIERKRKYDEALERAKIAREEAEVEARKCKEEVRTQRKEFEECKDRERRACKRIDVLMDEFTRAKEQWSSQSGVYEKEVRRARKEAFKSSSTVLKLQEENKHVNNELRGTKAKLDLAQRKAIKSEEEKFAAQYQLVAVQEELEKLQATLRIAQEEREALKKSLREDDIARIAAEGMIALPSANDDEPTLSPLDKENMSLPDIQLLRAKELERDLNVERRKRRAAQELVEFMGLEQRFQCYPYASTTRNRRSRDVSSTMGGGSANEHSVHMVEQQRTSTPQQHSTSTHDQTILSRSATPAQHSMTDQQEDRNEQYMTSSQLRENAERHPSPMQQQEDEEAQHSSVHDRPSNNERSPAIMRDRATTPERQSVSKTTHKHETPPVYHHDEAASHAAYHEQADHDTPDDDDRSDAHQVQTSEHESEPSTDRNSIRMVTKIMKVPMNFSPMKKPVEMSIEDTEPVQKADTKSYPFDREAALAAIAYRRGRARSFAQTQATPKKSVAGVVKDRRDVSAPVVTG